MTSKLISEHCKYILELIITKLSNPSSSSRTVLNTLNLIDFLLKNGSAKFKGEIEDETFFLKNVKKHFNDSYDILQKPIHSVIDKILETLENKDKLMKDREEAKKIRDRFKGFSNNNMEKKEKMDGISSDDYQQKQYDIRTKVDLNKKLGLEEQKKIEDKKNDKEAQKSVSENNDQDIDFLNSNKDDDFLNLNQEQPKKSKVKKLLPPPPKKGNKTRPKFHKTKQKKDDFLDLMETDNVIEQSPKKKQKKKLQNDFTELNLLDNTNEDQNLKQQKANDDLFDLNLKPEKNSKNEVKLTNKKKDDFLDLGDLVQEPKKDEQNLDSYLNFLNKTKLPQPPRKNMVQSHQGNYDFF